MIVLGIAGVIWLALVVTRKRTLMLAGSAILAGAWLWSAPATPALSKAAAMPPQSKAPKGSCASIAQDMSAAEVKTKLGDPDETRSDEETRGPGATMMLYRGSRCAVHLLDDKVEFIE